MFDERLRRTPLASALADAPRPPVPRADERDRWAEVPDDWRDAVLAEADRLSAVDWPMRRATDYLAFVHTGSRTADEAPYFLRRKKLCLGALACCLGRDRLDEVVDGLWCVSEETSWVISAHNVNPVPGAPAASEKPLPQPEDDYVDLFSAQTGMIFAWVDYLLGDRLDAVTPILRRRLRAEVERRVLRPFMERDDCWWMGFVRQDLCNWTPWIVSNVFMAACLLPRPKDERAALLERGCGMLDRWLRCVPEDGGCDEGAGYWNMAGGALLDCLELLETVTDGRFALWDEPKLRAIMTFPAKAALGGGWFVNFADCDARPLLSAERLLYAGEKLSEPALVRLALERQDGTMAALGDVPHFSRLLRSLFHPRPDTVPAEADAGDVWLPDLQLRVVRRGSYTLACKGGHNGESHNHNDVGSFILYRDGQPVAVDAGNMTYSAKTFSADRYTLWNTRSAYHNVPLIGGTEQRAGRAYAAREVRCEPDGLSLDLAGAYPAEAGAAALRRRLSLTADGLTVTDRVVLRSPQTVVWTLMLRQEPVLEDGSLLTCGVRVAWPAGLTASVEEIPVTDPRMAANYPGSLWRLRLASAPVTDADITIRIGGKNL